MSLRRLWPSTSNTIHTWRPFIPLILKSFSNCTVLLRFGSVGSVSRTSFNSFISSNAVSVKWDADFTTFNATKRLSWKIYKFSVTFWEFFHAPIIFNIFFLAFSVRSFDRAFYIFEVSDRTCRTRSSHFGNHPATACSFNLVKKTQSLHGQN